MNTRTTLGGVAVATAVATLFNVSAAMADAIPLPLSSVECRATIAKEYQKLLKAAFKTVTGCHKSRNKDVDLALIDCNNLLGAGDLLGPADLKDKYPGAAAKFVAAVNEVCGAEEPYLLQPDGVDPLEEDHYVSCPYTCDDVDNGINTMEQVADCLACTAAGVAGDIGATTLGMPGTLSAELGKCHGAIGKGYSKYALAALKAEMACQVDDDETGDNDIASCAGDDPKAKASGALTKAGEGIVNSCTPVAAMLSSLDSCATDTVANLELCNDTEWASAEDDAFTYAFDMPSNICPNAVRTRIRGGCSTQGSIEGICSSGYQTNTTLAVGWKGLAHGVDITDDYTLAGNLDCGAGTPGMCGDCTILGISIDNPQYDDFTRCKSNTSIKCSNPFGTDPVCPGTMECRYFLGPPLSISAGGTPTCSLNSVNSDITGTANPDDGSSEFFVDLRTLVYSGINQTHPCPYCRFQGLCNGGENDGDICATDAYCPDGTCVGVEEIPQDGVKNGKCVGGLNTGLACDVQAFDLSFAPTNADNPTAGSSLDCPPLSLANISGGGLAIGLQLSTGTVTKDAQDDCEPPNNALDCFCGVCSMDTNYSCDTDLDCSSVGKGDCGPYGGVNRKPNNCSDGFCDPVIGLTDRGACSGGHCLLGPTPGMPCIITPDCGLGGTCSLPDADVYCSGLLLANGKGIITCGVDADCDASVTGNPNPDAWVCPGDDCGTCSVSNFRSCFVDPLSLTGIPDVENPTLVGTFCLPPSTNGSVNSSTGSPGPGTVKTEAIVEQRF